MHTYLCDFRLQLSQTAQHQRDNEKLVWRQQSPQDSADLRFISPRPGIAAVDARTMGARPMYCTVCLFTPANYARGTNYYTAWWHMERQMCASVTL